MRKNKKILHPAWRHLEGVSISNDYFTKEAAGTITATENWVEFTKIFKDGEGKEFKVGEIVGLDEDEAKYVIKKGFAKESKKPDDDVLLKKSFDSFENNIVERVTKGLTDVMSKASNRIKDINFNPAVPKNHDAVYGFEDRGEFLKGIMDASRPTGAVISPKFFQGEGALGTYEDFQKGVGPFQKGTPSGQNTFIDDEGAILIPDIVTDGIWEYAIPDQDPFAQTDQRQTSGNSLKIKTVPNTSRKDGYRHAGALAYWMDEADQYTSSVIKWGEERLELNKLGALMYCTDEEIDDAAIALGPVFDKRMGQAINWKLNHSMFWGTGAGQPQGIMRADALITVAPAAAEIDAAGTLGHIDINSMYHRMLPGLRGGAEWVMHPNVYEKLELITFKDQTSSVVPIFMPPGGLTASPFGTLKGRPIRVFEFCSDLGIKGDIAFVNWNMYVTLTKAGRNRIKTASSVHLRFLYDETAFKANFRVDGMSMLPSSITDYNGTTERSAFVTLGTRRSEGTSSGL